MKYYIDDINVNSMQEFYNKIKEGYRYLSVHCSDEVKNEMISFLMDEKNHDLIMNDYVWLFIQCNIHDDNGDLSRDEIIGILLYIKNDLKINDARVDHLLALKYFQINEFDKSLEELQLGFKEGYPLAYYLQGRILANDNYAKKDYLAATQSFEKAVSFGFNYAYMRLGKMYSVPKYNMIDVNKAFEYFQKGAELGNPEGFSQIGYLYDTGKVIGQDYEKALDYYQKAADLGDDWGTRNLANLYADGNGVKQDIKKAIKLYEKAIELGDELSYKLLGNIYINSDFEFFNVEKAIECFRKYVELGHPKGYTEIGRMYEDGNGVEQDYSKAFEYYQKAADLDDSWGTRNLANLYKDGNGVKQDIKKAIKLYEKAIELGDNDALYLLGDIFYDSDSMFFNIEKAIDCYQKYADLGYGEYYTKIGYIYESGIGLEKDIETAFAYFQKAADEGDSWGTRNLANLYADGNGVEQDIKYAIKLYEKASSLGDGESYELLGDIYSNHDLGYDDVDKAFECYQKYAELGDPEGYTKIGRIYDKGDVVEQDYSKAFDYYQKAAESNDSWGIRNLANLYKDGNGVKQDIKKAIKLYEKAIELGDDKALYLLGDIFYDSDSKFFNIEKAIDCYQKYADLGYGEYYTKIGYIYESGIGLEMDIEAAFAYYKKAADLGDSWGNRNLANLFADGNGVEQDIKYAIKLYEKASSLGDITSNCLLGEIFSNVDKGFLNGKKAINYFMKYAQENPDGYTNIGYMYEDGIGVEKDIHKARDYYEKAYKEESAWGTRNLANLYRNGNGVVKNLQTAIDLYKKAIELEDDYASRLLASIYADNENEEFDSNEALYYYELSAEKFDDERSQFILGKEYATVGILSGIDLEKSIHYLEMSIENGLADAAIYLGDMYANGQIPNEEGEYKPNEAKAEEYYNKVPSDDSSYDEAQSRIKNLKKVQNSRRKDVFISWHQTKENRVLKDALSDSLKKLGLTVWDCDVSGSGEVDGSCLSAVSNSRVWMFLLTYDAVSNSSYMIKEMEIALESAKDGYKTCIFPIFDREAEKYVREHEDSEYSKLLNFIKNTYEDFDDIMLHIDQISQSASEKLCNRFIIDYKKYCKSDFATYKPSVSKTIRDGLAYKDSINNIIIPRLLKINGDSLNTPFEQINEPIVLIGESGIGKTTYLQHVAHKNCLVNQYFILNSQSLMRSLLFKLKNNTLEYRHFILDELTDMILKANDAISCTPSFRLLLEENFKKAGLSNDGEIYLIFDGFGETFIDEIGRSELLHCIKEFAGSSSNCNLIFATRNRQDYKLISDCLMKECVGVIFAKYNTRNYRDYYCNVIEKVNKEENRKIETSNSNGSQTDSSGKDGSSKGKSDEKKQLINEINRIISCLGDVSSLNPYLLTNISYYSCLARENQFYSYYQTLKNIVNFNKETDLEKLVFNTDQNYMKDIMLASQYHDDLMEYYCYCKANGSKKESRELFNDFFASHQNQELKENASELSRKYSSYLMARGYIVQDGSIDKVINDDYMVYYTSRYVFKNIISIKRFDGLNIDMQVMVPSMSFEELYEFLNSNIIISIIPNIIVVLSEMIDERIVETFECNDDESNTENIAVLVNLINALKEKTANDSSFKKAFDGITTQFDNKCYHSRELIEKLFVLEKNEEGE